VPAALRSTVVLVSLFCVGFDADFFTAVCWVTVVLLPSVFSLTLLSDVTWDLVDGVVVVLSTFVSEDTFVAWANASDEKTTAPMSNVFRIEITLLCGRFSMDRERPLGRQASRLPGGAKVAAVRRQTTGEVLMRLLTTLLAMGLSLPATVGAIERADVGHTIQAKQALVAAALAVREARFDWETAEALVQQAESGAEAARIEAQLAEERGAPSNATARAVTAAQRNLTRALSILQVKASELGDAERRMEDAETVLDQVDPSLEGAAR
jgi:hypothetical protein